MIQEILQISIDELQSNPLQPRGMITPDSLIDLVDSIKEHGILEPLVVAKTPAGYQIVAGERRWRAAKIAGLTHVPAMIKETSPRGMLEMAIVENVQRVDLNPLDRAKGLERLASEFNLSMSEIAVRIGKSAAYVSNSLRLLNLPDALKDGLLSGLITEGHARALASIEEHGIMLEAYKTILKESGSVRRAEELARRLKAKYNLPPKLKARKSGPHLVSDEIDQMQDNLNKLFTQEGEIPEDQATSIKVTRSRKQTRVLFIFRGDIAQTDGRMKKLYETLTGQTMPETKLH